MPDDAACVAFLQWALPELGLRWAGFRRPRAQVCKRLARRLRELGLPDLAAYRRLLAAQPDEWSALDALCRVTISRFWRDRGLFEALARDVLPCLAARAAARGAALLRAWSAGCGSGEEPFSLVLAWELGVPARSALGLRVLATDVDEDVLERARRAIYPESSLRELPLAWREVAFERVSQGLRLRDRFRTPVELRRADVRHALPEERFDLVLCRNLAFTYFAEPVQRCVLERLASRLVAGGALAVGRHEALPEGQPWFAPWGAATSLYERRAS